jgi:hypothetical protein
LTSVPTSGAARLPEEVAGKLSDAFGYSFWVVIGVSAVGLVAALILPKSRPVPASEGSSAVPVPVSD